MGCRWWQLFFFHTFIHSRHFFYLYFYLKPWKVCIPHVHLSFIISIKVYFVIDVNHDNQIFFIISRFILSQTIVCVLFSSSRCYKHTFAHLRNKQFHDIIFIYFLCFLYISTKKITSQTQRRERKGNFIFI
jgi:hypothetical protein